MKPGSGRRRERVRRADARQPNGRYTSESWRRYCRGRGGRKRAKHPKWLLRAWATNASRTKANRRRAELGRPLLPLIPLPVIDRPRAVFARECRNLARRRAAHDGVPYRDAMAWDPIVVREVCEKLGISYDPGRPRVYVNDERPMAAVSRQLRTSEYGQGFGACWTGLA